MLHNILTYIPYIIRRGSTNYVHYLDDHLTFDLSIYNTYAVDLSTSQYMLWQFYDD